MNHRLTPGERAHSDALLLHVRTAIEGLDPEVRFAVRRRLWNRLMLDERGTPAMRNKIKKAKHLAQQGKCGICGTELPLKYSELDRKKASAGYTMENTRLIHHQCHINDQAWRGYA